MLWSSIRRALPLVLACCSAPLVAGPAWAQGDDRDALLAQTEQLNRRARALLDSGDLKGAIEAQRGSLEVQERQLLPLVPFELQTRFRIAMTDGELFLLALLARDGQWQQAAELLERLIGFHEGVTGEDRYKSDLDDWRRQLPQLRENALLEQLERGVALQEQGRDGEALVVLGQVLPKLDAAQGMAPERLASANLAAGKAFANALAYVSAEARLEKALAFAERAFGGDSAELIPYLSQLGMLALRRGTHERGAKHLVRAHAIAQSRRSPALANTVLDLGSLLAARGDYPAAIGVLERAIVLFEARSDGDGFVNKLAARLKLASTQDDAGRHEDAEQSYFAVGKELSVLVTMVPAFAGLEAVYMRRYGVHHLRQGHYQQAEELLLRAIEVTKRFMPADSASVVQQGCDLGEVYWAAGDLPRSLGPIGRCFDSREQDIARVLATGTEEQKRAFLGEYLVAYQKTMNAQRLGGNSSEQLNRLALTQVLRTKGRVLDAMTGAGLAARASTNDETRALMTRLTALRAALASGAASGMSSPQQLKELGEEAASIEARLSEANPAFRAATRAIDIPSIQATLNDNHVLVELVAYRPLDAHYQKAAPELRYLAYVLHRVGAPIAIDLGEARPIDAAAAKLRSVISQPTKDPTAAARALYALVMKPLEAALRDKTQIFLSPDGALNAVPFAALVGPGGYLVDKYTFTYLTSGRDLLRFGSEKAAAGPFVVFANPAFGSADGRPPQGASKLARAVFHPLPGTQAEADTLTRLFPGTVVRTGSDANEAALKKVSRPFALHLATHGFFLSSEALETRQGKAGQSLGAMANQLLAVAENPLLRSGLAFAGATGLRGQDGEDGVLTALEASSLDLTGTQLVVLSACQTAEGEVTQGEGVYGLRRALTVAGADSLLMSLWSVDDEATAYLMRGFYRRLKEGSGRSDALRSVQLVLAKHAATQHPYYWAAFIPSGNPGPLQLPASVVSGNESAAATSTGPSETSGSASSSGSSGESGYDSDDWPTATPALGGSLGVARLSLDPTAKPELAGWDGHLSMDISPLGAGLEDDLGNESRGWALYDRLGANLSLLSLKGESMGALHWDYTLVFGYRARLIGLFAGARYGSGVISVSDGPKNTGSYCPLAARLELPWFWDSRLSAVGYSGGLLGRRDTLGLDVRVPLGGPTIWLQGGFLRTEGKPGQNNVAMQVPIGIGFSE